MPAFTPLTRALFYYLPPALVMAGALALSTPLGNYNASVSALYGGFAFLAPTLPRPDTATMYTLNYLARRAAFLVEYGALTALAVRALQGGVPDLKRRTIVAALALAAGFALTDNLVRALSLGRHGGADDLATNALGALIVLPCVFGFFAVKRWERAMLAADALPRTVQAVPDAAECVPLAAEAVE